MARGSVSRLQLSYTLISFLQQQCMLLPRPEPVLMLRAALQHIMAATIDHHPPYRINVHNSTHDVMQGKPTTC